MEAILLDVPRNLCVLAAGFASAWMLAWAGAASIPLVIHLLTRRRQVQVKWAAMQLLQQVIDKESKRVRLEQLLLLMMRCAILLLLALALAAPYLSSTSTETGAANRARLWIIGIDVSYSMGYRQKDVTRLQKAKDAIQDALSESQAGDSFVLIELSSPSKALIRRPTYNRDKLQAEIRSLELKDLSADIRGAVSLIDSILDDAEKSLSTTDATVLIASDLGVDSWRDESEEGGGERSNLNASLERLCKRVDCRFFSVAETSCPNCAITQLNTTKRTCLIGETIDVSVGVAAFGNSTPKEVLVELSMNNQELETRTIELGPGMKTTLTFSVELKATGSHLITARIPRDELIADNDRSWVIDVRRQNRILFLEENLGDTRLLRYSLAPPSDAEINLASSRSKSGFRTMSVNQSTSITWSDWDAVVLSDVRLIDSLLLRQLHRFTKRGGCVFVEFGPGTNPNTWNHQLEEVDLLGFRFTSPANDQLWTVDPADYESPVLQPFEGFPNSGLITTPIFRYWQIDQLSENLKIDLKVGEQNPLIVRHPIGKGWVASLLTNSGSSQQSKQEQWNALASWPSFVPLMQRLFQVLFDAELETYNVDCGQLVQGRTENTIPTDVELVLSNGDRSTLTSELLPDSDGYGWTTQATSNHGTLIATELNRPEKQQPFAINLIANESSLESISPRELPNSQLRIAREDESEVTDQRERFSALTRLLLVLLLGLLVSESVAARLIGRRGG